MIRIHNEDGSTTVIKPRMSCRHVDYTTGIKGFVYTCAITDPVTGISAVGMGVRMEDAHRRMANHYTEQFTQKGKVKWFWPLFLSAASIAFLCMMVWKATH